MSGRGAVADADNLARIEESFAATTFEHGYRRCVDVDCVDADLPGIYHCALCHGLKWLPAFDDETLFCEPINKSTEDPQ